MALVLGVAAWAPPAPAEDGSPAANPAGATASAQRNPDWATPVGTGLNLYRITDRFYRSRQLSKDDVARLQTLGIRTVVSLRAYHSDTALLAGTGIREVRIPIRTWDVGDVEVAAALSAIRSAEPLGPVLLHCQHGADRTGLVSAMYRMVFQGWSKAQALDELESGGYGFHAIWRNITSYIRDVDLDAMRRKLDNGRGAS